MKNKLLIEVTWTGRYPCFCHGEWLISINGKDYSKYIPYEKKSKPMNTYRKYSR